MRLLLDFMGGGAGRSGLRAAEMCIRCLVVGKMQSERPLLDNSGRTKERRPLDKKAETNLLSRYSMIT